VPCSGTRFTSRTPEVERPLEKKAVGDHGEMEAVLTAAFCAAYPDGVFGILIARGCVNRPRALAIDPDKEAVEVRLRERFPGDAIDADPVARAYARYFRRYGGRYPVVHQAKAVLAGRSIESDSVLVEAMFTAELDSLILTSGHDLHELRGPLVVDVAVAGDAYTKLSGRDQMLKAGDMIVRDATGIIASVAYGPDDRTRIRSHTDAALFGAWCPAGIAVATVETHLERLAALLRREWPQAVVDPPKIWHKGRTA
jgi:DNA/RNA-binding domain of Phe-tRNA-synthetase-like protein